MRPEAWLIEAQGHLLGAGAVDRVASAGLPARLAKAAYLGSIYEYTFETALGRIFVVSPDLDRVLAVGSDATLRLAGHGVSVVPAT